MTGRKLFISLSLLFLVIGHMGAFFSEVEPWPFSSYPMYSKFPEDLETISLYVPVFIPEEGKPIIAVAANSLKPLTRFSIIEWSQKVAEPETDESVKLEIMKGFLNLFQKNMIDSRGKEVPLKEIKINKVTWKLLLDASNANTPTKIEEIFSFVPDKNLG